MSCNLPACDIKQKESSTSSELFFVYNYTKQTITSSAAFPHNFMRFVAPTLLFKGCPKRSSTTQVHPFYFHFLCQPTNRRHISNRTHLILWYQITKTNNKLSLYTKIKLGDPTNFFFHDTWLNSVPLLSF